MTGRDTDPDDFVDEFINDLFDKNKEDAEIDTRIDIRTHLMLLNDERNCLHYWYPRIKDVVPTPKTAWLEISTEEMQSPEKLANKVAELIDKEGFKYPVFMRTDGFSGKHDFKETCYVKTKKRIKTQLMNLISLASSLNLVTRAIVVREFLELDSRFHAFFGRLPISTEVRVMVRDNKIDEWFFYWPDDAILNPDKKNWRQILSEMRATADKEKELFLGMAEKVAEIMDGYWSVDFARTKAGGWVLIDMALGEVSWRPSIR